jgi:hypothetical protein
VEEALTTTQLLAAAAEVLESSGYQAAPTPDSWDSSTARLFEDAYGIVAAVTFETWADLAEQWPDSQAALVDVMSAHLSRPDPKAWEGYLLLMTPSAPPLVDRSKVTAIRYNTDRVRKIIATGDELLAVNDVRAALLPLLPLQIGNGASGGPALLERLPTLLAPLGVEERATQTVVSAFVENASIMERLHDLRT